MLPRGIMLIATLSVCEAFKHSTAVHLKPTGETDSIYLMRGPVNCSFEWNVVGGTDEEWILQITGDKAKRTFTCEIERPEQKSYLYFQSFKLMISRLDKANLFDSNNNELKEDHDFLVAGDFVISKHPGFGGSLHEITLETQPWPKREKGEL